MRPQILDRQIGVEPRDDFAESPASSGSGSAPVLHVEGDAADLRRVALAVRPEEQRRNRVLDLAVLLAFCTRPTISDVERRVVAAIADVLADGVASEIELLRERLVDDRDLRRAFRRRRA